MHRLSAVLAVLLFISLPFDAHSQNPRRTERAFVGSPAALGMGDVGVARPFGMSSFFYNPAHAAESGTSIRVLGMQGAISDQVRDQARFYNERMSPAIDRGLGDMPADELETLYDNTVSQWGRYMGHVASIIGGAYTQERYGTGTEDVTSRHPAGDARESDRLYGRRVCGCRRFGDRPHGGDDAEIHEALHVL